MENKDRYKKLISLLVIGIVLISLAWSFFKPKEKPIEPVVTPTPTSDVVETKSPEPTIEPTPEPTVESKLDEHGIYDSKEDVALFIYTYHRLPDNYMTKKEARKHGWDGGALHLVVKDMCIGGDVYTNYEGTLPEKIGVTYYECDIDTLTKKKRGAKRIVYSDDWNIYYTSDHYDSFELLYGEDEPS